MQQPQHVLAPLVSGYRQFVEISNPDSLIVERHEYQTAKFIYRNALIDTRIAIDMDFYKSDSSIISVRTFDSIHWAFGSLSDGINLSEMKIC